MDKTPAVRKIHIACPHECCGGHSTVVTKHDPKCMRPDCTQNIESMEGQWKVTQEYLARGFDQEQWPRRIYHFLKK